MSAAISKVFHQYVPFRVSYDSQMITQWGCSSTHFNCSFEPTSMRTARFHLNGSRELIMASYSTVFSCVDKLSQDTGAVCCKSVLNYPGGW